MTPSWPAWFEALPETSERHRHEFLAGVHVGVLEFELPEEGAYRSPVWCRIEDGWVVISLAVTEPHHERITEIGWVTVEIGDDAPPFGRIVVEGPIEFVETPSHVERIVVATVRPERWRRG